MNHSFNPSPLDKTRCSHKDCGLAEIAHTDKAVCDSCPNIGEMNLHRPLNGPWMLLCRECIAREKETERVVIEKALAYQSPELQEARLAEWKSNNPVIAASKIIDAGVHITSDLFNAETVAIVDIKRAIDEDDTIENKNYKLAEVVLERFEKDKALIFEANQTIIEATNRQKADQVYLNQLANKLRSEEREKLKIADINYKPETPKINKPKLIKVTGKIAKAELDKAAKELSEFGIQPFMIQMIVNKNKCTVSEAVSILRRNFKETISMSSESK